MAKDVNRTIRKGRRTQKHGVTPAGLVPAAQWQTNTHSEATISLGVPRGLFGILPERLLLRIVQALPFEDRIRMAATCNQLGNYIYSAPSLWKEIAISADKNPTLNNIQLATILRKCHAAETTQSFSLAGFTLIRSCGILPLQSSTVLSRFVFDSSFILPQFEAANMEALLRPMLKQGLKEVKFSSILSRSHPGLRQLENDTRRPLGCFRAVPDAIILKVAALLPLEGRVKLASTSKVLGKIVYTCPSLWRNIIFSPATAANVTDAQLHALLCNCHGSTSTRAISLLNCSNADFTGSGLRSLRYSQTLHTIDLRTAPVHAITCGPTGLDDELVTGILATMLPQEHCFCVDFGDVHSGGRLEELLHHPTLAECNALYKKPTLPTIVYNSEQWKPFCPAADVYDPSTPLREADSARAYTIFKMIPSLLKAVDQDDEMACLPALKMLESICSQGSTAAYDAVVTKILPRTIDLIASATTPNTVAQQALTLLQRNIELDRSTFIGNALAGGLLPALARILDLERPGQAKAKSECDDALGPVDWRVQQQRRVSALLYTLSTKPESVDIAKLIQMVPIVAQMSTSNDVEVACQGAFTVANMAGLQSCDLAQSLVDGEVVQRLLQQVGDHVSHPGIVAAVLSVLKNLACTPNVEFHTIRGGVGTLQRLLAPESPKSTIAATSKAIAAFAVESQKQGGSQLSDIAQTAVSLLIGTMDAMQGDALVGALTSIGTMLEIGSLFDDGDLISQAFQDFGGLDLLKWLQRNKDQQVSGMSAELYGKHFERFDVDTRGRQYSLMHVKVRKQHSFFQAPRSVTGSRYSTAVRGLLSLAADNVVANNARLNSNAATATTTFASLTTQH